MCIREYEWIYMEKMKAVALLFIYLFIFANSHKALDSFIGSNFAFLFLYICTVKFLKLVLRN
jgi:hypothetical protein